MGAARIVHEKALELYKQGKNDRQIAEEFGVTDRAVHLWRKRKDLPAVSHIKAEKKLRAAEIEITREQPKSGAETDFAGRVLKQVQAVFLADVSQLCRKHAAELAEYYAGGGDCAEFAVALAVRAVLGELAGRKEKKEAR